MHCYLNVLQADLICIQWNLNTGLQKLLQIANGLIDVNILLNQIWCSDGLLLNTIGKRGEGKELSMCSCCMCKSMQFNQPSFCLPFLQACLLLPFIDLDLYHLFRFTFRHSVLCRKPNCRKVMKVMLDCNSYILQHINRAKNIQEKNNYTVKAIGDIYVQLFTI